jgi:hypothetical protein
MKAVARVVLLGMLLLFIGCASGSVSVDTDAFTGDGEAASSKRVQMLEKRVGQLEDRVESLEERLERVE